MTVGEAERFYEGDEDPGRIFAIFDELHSGQLTAKAA